MAAGELNAKTSDMLGFSEALYPYVPGTIILGVRIVTTSSPRSLNTRKMAEEADLKRGRSQMEAEGSKLIHLRANADLGGVVAARFPPATKTSCRT
jgi:hypothetical protein